MLIAYCVAAGGALQIADIVSHSLPMPSWTMAALVTASGVGLPVAALIAWIFDWNKEGIVRTAPVAGASPKPLIWFGALIAVVAIGLGGTWLYRKRAVSQGATAGVVAVLPFAVRGSEQYAYLREGMVDLLSQTLAAPPHLRAVDARALLSYAKDESDAQAVAGHFSAGLYIVGSILEVKDKLHIHAQIFDVTAPSAPRAEASVEGEAGKLFELVDQLNTQLQGGALGMKMDGPGSRLDRAAQAMTSSVPGLKAFLEGQAAMRKLDFKAAIGGFREAVKRDPDFTLAWYRLAVAAGWIPDMKTTVDEGVQHALAGASRLSSHDQKLVEGYAAFIEGRGTASEAAYRSILKDHPDDVEAWYQLGDVLYHLASFQGRSPAECREPFQRALVLDPSMAPAFLHLADLARREGQKLEEAALFEKLLAIRADDPNADAVRWEIAWATGDDVRQKRLEEKISKSLPLLGASAAFAVSHRDGFADLNRLVSYLPKELDRETRSQVLPSLARLHAAEGKFAQAFADSSAFAEVAPKGSTTPRALLAAFPLAPLTERERRAEAEAIGTYTRGTDERQKLYVHGVILAQLGDPAGLRDADALDKLGGRYEKDLATSIRANLAWAHKDAAATLAALEKRSDGVPERLDLQSFSQGIGDRYLRVVALRALGRKEEALRWAQLPLPPSDRDLYWTAPMALQAAQLLEETGHADEAVLQYEQVSRTWKDCDPPLRTYVALADSALARLRTQVSAAETAR